MAAALLLAFGICFTHATSAADPLGSYPVDPKLVSVAGISSAAFMANQMHIAHSAGIKGAALIAGGLYGCAVENVLSNGVVGLVSWATGRCMNARQLRDPPFYKDRADDFAKRGWIDPLDNLKSSRVYLFTGGEDIVVKPLVVERASELYKELGVPEGQIELVDKDPRAPPQDIPGLPKTSAMNVAPLAHRS